MSDLPSELWGCVQACLDERRDPLDEPAVCTWLEAHPEALEGFARWRELWGPFSAGVARVPVGKPRVAAASMGAAVALLAAACVVAALVLRLWIGGGPTEVAVEVGFDEPAAFAPPRLSRRGRCLFHSTTLQVVGESERFERRMEAGQVLRSVRETFYAQDVPEALGGGAVTASSRSRSNQKVVVP